MLDRCAQIGGGDQGHERKNCVQFVQSDLDRCNWRWQGRVEWRGDVLDLGKCAVGSENVKHAKAFFPVRKCAQKGKRGCRAQAVHAVLGAYDVAAATVRQRQCFAQGSIAREHSRFRRNSVQGRSRDRGFTLCGRISVNGAPPDVRLQPVRKTLRGFGFRRINFVNYLALLQDRSAVATLGQGQIAILAQAHTDPSFQGKSRQYVLPKTTVGKRFWNAECHGLVVGFGG